MSSLKKNTIFRKIFEIQPLIICVSIHFLMACESDTPAQSRKNVAIGPPQSEDFSAAKTPTETQKKDSETQTNQKNSPPIFEGLQSVEAKAGAPTALIFNVTDPDLDEIVRIDLLVNDSAVGEVSIDPKSPFTTITFPQDYATGSISATVTAWDSNNLSSKGNFMIFVKAKKSNCSETGTIGTTIACQLINR